MLQVIWKRIVEEPVATMALIRAAIAVAVVFGMVDLSAEGKAALLVFAEAALTFATRQSVVPLGGK